LIGLHVEDQEKGVVVAEAVGERIEVDLSLGKVNGRFTRTAPCMVGF
jgi:hypothetical protein